jgi:phage gpG-like protein
MADYNTDGLDKLLKALKKPPSIKVGILGSNDSRNGKASSNATVGAAHEFGTSTLPQRSFLRVPLSDNLSKALQKAGLLEKKVIAEAVKTGSLIKLLKQIAITAEAVVLDAFDTGGDGKWKPSNMTKKKNQQTLVETQQLRNSITSEVAE